MSDSLTLTLTGSCKGVPVNLEIHNIKDFVFTRRTSQTHVSDLNAGYIEYETEPYHEFSVQGHFSFKLSNTVPSELEINNDE
jgi:hypothetical protein